MTKLEAKIARGFQLRSTDAFFPAGASGIIYVDPETPGGDTSTGYVLLDRKYLRALLKVTDTDYITLTRDGSEAWPRAEHECLEVWAILDGRRAKAAA